MAGFLNKRLFFLIVNKKRKTTKSAVKSMFTALLLFCCKIFMSLSFLYKGVQICRLVFVGVFQGLYRQSGLYRNFRYGFFISAFLQDYS